jgi:CubicO group peptidase (beta-lactamase class C family)
MDGAVRTTGKDRSTDGARAGAACGEFYARGGLLLRPRDLAKIGQLVMNHGTWHGRRIVSAAWINQMTARQSGLGEQSAWRHEAYGYLWWLGQKSVGDRDID